MNAGSRSSYCKVKRQIEYSIGIVYHFNQNKYFPKISNSNLILGRGVGGRRSSANVIWEGVGKRA
jgi:hypothetical protein